MRKILIIFAGLFIPGQEKVWNLKKVKMGREKVLKIENYSSGD